MSLGNSGEMSILTHLHKKIFWSKTNKENDYLKNDIKIACILKCKNIQMCLNL